MNDDDDFLPEVYKSVRDDDVLASIAADSAEDRVGKIVWALLKPDDEVSIGTIVVAAGEEHRAACELNERVRSSFVSRETKSGMDAVENFHCRARVRPTWRRLAGGNNSLVNLFAIPLSEELGYRPYRPAFQRTSADRRVRLEIKNLMALRWANRVCRTRLMERRHEFPLPDWPDAT